MALGISPTVDFVFKLIYGQTVNADILIDLLNAVLQWDVPIVSVRILNPFNEKKFANGKVSVVDIKAQDALGRSYIIEMQTSLPTGLENRWVYYTCGLYFEQLREGDSYGDLRPAICIVFLSRTLFPETTAGHLRFALYDEAHDLTLGDQLQVHVVELPKFNLDEQTIGKASALEQWAFFLQRAANYTADKLRRLLTRPAFQKATGVLEMISRNPKFRLLHDDRAKEALDRFSAEKDAKLSLQRGMERGMERGRLIGRIVTLQQILGDAESDESTLTKLGVPELTEMAQQLELRFQSRR